MANFITLYLFHGDYFCGQPIDAYKGGEVKIANEVILEQLSFIEIDKYLQELEYGDDVKYFYKYPDEDFEKLKILLNEEDLQKMIDNIGSSDTIELFVEHKIEKWREEENKEEEEDFESEDDVDTGWMIESDDERIDEDLHNTEVDGIIRDEVEECFSLWELSDGEGGNMEEKGWDSDHLEMIDDSDDEHVHKYPEFNEEVDLKEKIKFEVGLRFRSIQGFKDALVKNSVEDGRGFSYVKNDKERVKVVCAQKCGWSMHASWSNDRQSFQIKTFKNEHKCGRHYENPKFTYKWVARMYFEEIRDNPKWEPSKMAARIAREHGLVVTRSTCYKAKRKVIRSLEGDIAAQYTRLWDYCEAVKKWNPGTTMKLEVEDHYFKRLYVFLDACKRGFLSGCRPIIGLDGCHLKTALGGCLLVAVGKDGNEEIFPICYAVVEGENKDSWGWFLTLLQEDLGTVLEKGWTFISDQHTGLVQYIDERLPYAEHRYCVRHMYKNFNKLHKGQTLRDRMWAAAKASNQTSFTKAMEQVRVCSREAYDWLTGKDPKKWSRHAFRKWPKSDMLLNNISESFNSYILEAREKPIISMLEMIRRKLMHRLQVKREKMVTWHGNITPKVIKKIDKCRAELGDYRVCWGGGPRFEVDHIQGVKTLVVDLEAKMCDCGRWDLTGIPCIHAMVAILYHKKNPEDYINVFYSIKTYAKAYEYVINPMPGPDKWPKTRWDDILPPKVKNQPGRPKKRRRRDPNIEPTTNLPQYRISREGNRLKCGNCREVGHNSLKCTKPKNPNYVKRVKKVTPNNQGASSTKKRGRKPKNIATDPTSQSSQVNSNISGTTTN